MNLNRMKKLAGLLNENVEGEEQEVNEAITNYSVVMGMYVTDQNRAYGAYQEAEFAQEELKKAGIKSEILVQVRVSKSDERKSINVLSDAGIDTEQQVKM